MNKIIPVEIVEHIYEYVNGTPKDNFNHVIRNINALSKMKYGVSRGMICQGIPETYLTKSYTFGVLEEGIEVIEYRKYFDDYPDYFTDDEED
jgi:hypothetical protein